MKIPTIEEIENAVMDIDGCHIDCSYRHEYNHLFKECSKFTRNLLQAVEDKRVAVVLCEGRFNNVEDISEKIEGLEDSLFCIRGMISEHDGLKGDDGMSCYRENLEEMIVWDFEDFYHKNIKAANTEELIAGFWEG